MAGTYRPDRHAGLPEGPPPGEPIRPAGLAGAAATFWDATVPDLVRAGAVGAVDSFALEAAAETWGLYVSALAAAKVDPTSKVLRSAVTSYLQTWLTLAGKLCLTPGDRARLRLDLSVNAAEPDPMAQFLDERPGRIVG